MPRIMVMMRGGPWNGSLFDSEGIDEEKRQFAICCYEASNLGEPERILNNQALAELNELRRKDGREERKTLFISSHKVVSRDIDEVEQIVSLEIEWLGTGDSDLPGTVRLFPEDAMPTDESGVEPDGDS